MSWAALFSTTQGILRDVLRPSGEAHLGPSQASKMDIFVRIVNVFKLTLLLFYKKFNRRCLKSPNYTPGLF